MIKTISIWALEILFTFSFLGYNITLGSTFYNWLSALFGGFLYYWLMRYDEEVPNKAALRMVFVGPPLAVVFGPIICLKLGIALEHPNAKGIYLVFAFLGLTIATFIYNLSKKAKSEGPSIAWNFIMKWWGTKTKEKNANQ